MILEILGSGGEPVRDASVLESTVASLNITGSDEFSVPFEIHEGQLEVRQTSLIYNALHHTLSPPPPTTTTTTSPPPAPLPLSALILVNRCLLHRCVPQRCRLPNA